MIYRDSHGKSLEDYPRPSVAADTAVLTIAGDRLCVLLTLTNDATRREEAEWRLPGTFIHSGETLRDAATRALRDKAGVVGVEVRQLHVFDAPQRDDRGWVLSVAHYGVGRAEALMTSERVRLAPVDELPPLKYDHAAIVAFAVDSVRTDYRRSPDPERLLLEPFTIRQLRLLHEIVLGEQLLPDTFRRTMLDKLTPTGAQLREGRGRPAELYLRA
jgi:ADP-ribose pyrophosphatase YjhB (NUDIX family)